MIQNRNGWNFLKNCLLCKGSVHDEINHLAYIFVCGMLQLSRLGAELGGGSRSVQKCITEKSVTVQVRGFIPTRTVVGNDAYALEAAS
jgi:hypothetical protein